jgi:hypothetical protein
MLFLPLSVQQSPNDLASDPFFAPIETLNKVIQAP